MSAHNTLAAQANALNKLSREYQRRKRGYEAKLEPLKAQLDALEAELLAAMRAQDQEAVGTRYTTVAIKRNDFAELYDDKEFFEYVGKKKAWDLLYRRVNVAAARERWEDKVAIPGVRAGVKMSLSITSKRAKS